MHRPSRRFVAVIATAAMVMALTSCIVAVAGARCRTKEIGNDATHVLVCKNGRWVRFISKADGLALINRLKAEAAARTTTTTVATPTTAAPTTMAPTTTTAPPPPPSYAIGAGYQHTCAVIAGVVKCLGANTNGELGNGTTTSSMSFVSTGLTDAVATTGGSGFSCALKANGTVWCWGYGNGGYLGDGLNATSLVPVQVSGLTDATQISTGANGSCARTAAGLVRCWGTGSLRGDGAGGGATTPTTVSLTGVTRIGVGGSHACAVKSDGTVWCWGTDSEGQLGNGTTTTVIPTPVQATGITNAVDVAAGGFNGASCAVLATGSVQCWGDDSYSQTGDGDSSPTDHLTPSPVSNMTDARRVAVGFYSSCVTRASGAVSCWGLGGYLGDGTTTASSVPVTTIAVGNATSINAQATHTCVVQSTNTASCWGANLQGELGGGVSTTVQYAVGVVGMP